MDVHVPLPLSKVSFNPSQSNPRFSLKVPKSEQLVKYKYTKNKSDT